MQMIKPTIAATALIVAAAASAQTGIPVVTSPAAPPAAVPEKIICKTELETGSLVKRTKTCFTRKQWNYVNEQHERAARKLVEDGTGRPGSN